MSARFETPEGAAPYLDPNPPPWAARSLAWILLAVFSVAALAAAVLRVPETVTATFVVAPVRGTDPVRAFKDGIVTQVRALDAHSVRAGETMFTIASPPVGDRAAEWEGLKVQIAGAGERLANARQKYDGERRADGETERQLKARLESLDRTIAKNDEQLKLAAELAERQKKIFEEGVSSWMDVARLQLEINRLEVEAEQARAQREETRRAVEKLGFERRSREAQFREVERELAEELSKANSRGAMLETELARTGSQLTVAAPCAGSVLRLHVRRAGATVREGDLLAELACEGQTLQAELLLPQDGMALVRAGQPVKLLYDAFPYQRYGVRQATIRWISPESVGEKGGASAFRALADLRDTTVLVHGQPRPVVSGMGGRARVIVGRRSLISYAFEPLRQLKESLAGEK
jgi:membrane fusion protein